MRTASIHRFAVLLSILGTALILLWIGIFKFTPTEAKAIQSLLNNSPFTSWMTPALGVQAASNLIGAVEILTALLLACILLRQRLFQRFAFAGGVLGVLTFLCTLSFLATTPGAFAVHDGVLLPDAFLLKDVVLLGASLLCIAETLPSLQESSLQESALPMPSLQAL